MLSPPRDHRALRRVGLRPARRLSGAERTDRADEAEGVAGLRERRDLDDVAGVRRLDEAAVTDVHPLVLRAARARLEKDEVARAERPRRHTRAFVELRAGVMGELDAELGVDVHHEARAVEARERVCAAPDV